MHGLARWLPASGLLAVVALALTGVISPPPPVAGASSIDIAGYYTSHRLGLEAESVADGVGAMFLVMFAAVFHARFRIVPSLTALVAAAILASCMLAQVAVFHTLAFRSLPDASRATILSDLQSFGFQVTTFPALLFLGAAGAAILSSHILPRWLGLAAAAAATLQAVSWISFFAPDGTLAAGGLPDIVSFVALLLWTFSCSIALLAQPPNRVAEGSSARGDPSAR